MHEPRYESWNDGQLRRLPCMTCEHFARVDNDGEYTDDPDGAPYCCVAGDAMCEDDMFEMRGCDAHTMRTS